MDNININLYSRQIGEYGIKTMNELTKLKVLILGMRGLGVETTKNILLTGIKEINIFDAEKCSINDLGANYFINENDVINGKRRDEASLEGLRKLNSYVNLSIMEGEDIFLNLNKYNVIIITEMIEENILINLNEECRKNHIGFIYSCALGISGFIFTDFGENFIIKDFNGVKTKSFVIKNISNEKQGLITIDDSIEWDNKFTLNDDDMVILSDIKGMEELNDGKPRNIIKINNKSFYIKEDTTQFGKYTQGGKIKEYKKPIIKNYKSLEERIKTPFENNTFIQPIDYTKGGINPILHCGFMALQNYFSKNKKLPELNDLKESINIIKFARDLYTENKEKKVEWMEDANEFDEKIIENIIRWSKAEISPICSIIGGMLSQEVIKYTGKYTPIDQWIWFDFFETVSLLDENIERILKGTRYDDLISIYGNDIQKKLENLNVFMIGTGANGCEFLKNFALMGISCSNGNIVISDNDVIELSNLNRQFLFRNENIGEYKSKIASKNIKTINPTINIKDFQLIVCEETEDIFNDLFWKDQNIIIFGVDNNEARKYIDTQCVNYKLIGIDSGTLGTIGRIDLIIPDKTNCLRDVLENDEEESFPMCSIHNFPNTIHHCIEWGKMKFLEITNEGISHVKNYIKESKLYISKIKEENPKNYLDLIYLIYEFINLIIHQNPKDLLNFCVQLYTKLFDYDIQYILNKFPQDLINKDGTLYWSGAKRIPHPIKYNINDELCFMFVKNFSILLSKQFNIPIDESFLQEQSEKIVIEPFIILTDVEIKKKSEQQIIKLEKLKLDEKEIEKINAIKSIEFNKDDDIQISIIHSFANLRANNFSIENCSFIKTKIVTGKIIPSIPSTTACVGGFVSLQILNLVQTNDLKVMRNTFFNLGVSLISQLEPEKLKHHEDYEIEPILNKPVRVVPNGWTVWDQIEIKSSKTCKDLIEYIKLIYNVEINLISSNSIIIFDSHSKKSKLNIDKTIEEIYDLKIQKSNKKNYLWLSVSGKLEKLNTIMPKIKYIYKTN